MLVNIQSKRKYLRKANLPLKGKKTGKRFQPSPCVVNLGFQCSLISLWPVHSFTGLISTRVQMCL